ncbi:MAG: hypothetical protein E7191_05500 [Erysipelotrichaceae bacterium]|nr:hypothetical protein [Erysipelotrichaceae bacterium]
MSDIKHVVHVIDPKTEKIIERNVGVFDDFKSAAEYIRKMTETLEPLKIDIGFVIDAVEGEVDSNES